MLYLPKELRHLILSYYVYALPLYKRQSNAKIWEKFQSRDKIMTWITILNRRHLRSDKKFGSIGSAVDHIRHGKITSFAMRLSWDAMLRTNGLSDFRKLPLLHIMLLLVNGGSIWTECLIVWRMFTLGGSEKPGRLKAPVMSCGISFVSYEKFSQRVNGA